MTLLLQCVKNSVIISTSLSTLRRNLYQKTAFSTLKNKLNTSLYLPQLNAHLTSIQTNEPSLAISRSVRNDKYRTSRYVQTAPCVQTTPCVQTRLGVPGYVRGYCSSRESDDEYVVDQLEEDPQTVLSSADTLLKDAQYEARFREYCRIPGAGHKVFILQIVEKRRNVQLPDNYGELKLAENIALVESIPGWTVVDKIIFETRPGPGFLYHRSLNGVVSKICAIPGVSALFITVNELSAAQTVELQDRVNMPVFNRAFMIIQAFKSQARSKEAKMQVALAELPHLKFQYGISNESRRFLASRSAHFMLKDREKKLKATLLALKRQRNKLRETRSRRKMPTVAVIGYTNCGKTTLIKALTGDEDMLPENRLFATLDVTLHAGQLPNHMSVLYIDTMGFISDLPRRLKDAFSATLEDTMIADLVIHVTDGSHPDCISQQDDVMHQVSHILSKQNLDTMIQVYNKSDQISSSERITDGLLISAVTGEGLDVLKQRIQSDLLANIKYLQKKLKIPLNGPHLSWLRKEATVVSMETDVDPENLVVNVHISAENYHKFLARFSNRKLNSSKFRAQTYS